MNKKAFQRKSLSSYLPLFASAAPWIIAGLWIGQTSHLKAMEKEEKDHLKRTEKSVVTRTQQQRRERSLPKRSENEHLSDRLKQIIISAKDLDKINAEKIEHCKEILKCTKENFIPPQGFSEIIFNDLIISNKDKGGGFSGAIVPPPIIRNGKRIIVKQFEEVYYGIKELLESLAVWELNSVPTTLKMAKICDAAYCINDSEECFSIIMECASGEDIKACLSKNCAEDAIRAFAEYLAEFHIHHHGQINEAINKEKYISHASKFVHTLSKNPLDEEEKKEIALLDLIVKKQLKDLQAIKSHNVLQLLTTDEQQKFACLVKGITRNFIKNASEIYRLLNSDDIKKREHCFSTRTHGDAHSKNFFFNNSPEAQRSALTYFHLVEMIDYASMIKTYEKIGNPAEDVGRFLGSLWEWAAQESEHASETIKQALYDKIIALQAIFMDMYSKKIKSTISTEKAQQRFEKMLKEDCDFYKLRFLRVIFNSAQDKEIKLKIIKYFLQENAKEIDSLQQKAFATKFIGEEYDLRHWRHLEEETLYCNLPDPVEGFITSTAEGTDSTYLTKLWQILNEKGIATLTSTATLAGEGGIGKTTLAIAYGQEALHNQAYSVIYKILGSTEETLLKSYRDLLHELGRGSDESIELQRASKLIKLHLPENALLIIDNVPDAYADGTPAAAFLKDILPQNKHTHLIITSRSHEGWESILSLEAFRPTESENYLLNITKLKDTKENREIAGKLAEELQHFPLALSHAASYLKLLGGEDISAKHFEDYLEGFKNLTVDYFEKKKNILEVEKSKITYEYLIDKTLRMSKNHLSKLAEKLMVYSAYLNPDDISEDIFLGCWLNAKKLVEVQKDDPYAIPEGIFLEQRPDQKELDQALKQLTSLSLIKRTSKEPLFSIHRLVQLVMRNERESKKNPQYEKIFPHLVFAFNALFKNNIYTDYQVNKLWNNFPHIMQLLKHTGRLEIASEEIRKLKWIAVLLCNIPLKKCDEKKLTAIFDGIPTLSEILHVKGAFNYPDWFTQLVEESNPTIQFALSQIAPYDEDFPDPLYWAKKAARRGLAEAQDYLGSLYNSSKRGFPSSDYKAIKWYTRAAEQGYAESQSLLGYMYATGGLVRRDQSKANKYFRMAAKQGEVRAQFELGIIYEEDKNEIKSVKWYTRAAKQGHAIAQLYVGRAYLNGLGVEKNDSLAIEWLTKAAEQDHKDAQCILGIMYADGLGVDKNEIQAIHWFKEAGKGSDHYHSMNQWIAKSHSPSATSWFAKDNIKLAELYLMWMGKRALILSPFNKEKHTQFYFWHIYSQGLGVKQDYCKAMQYLEEAAQQGLPIAQCLFGLILFDDYFLNLTILLKWFEKAALKGEMLAINYFKDGAEEGNSDCQFYLGNFYYYGECQKQNTIDAQIKREESSEILNYIYVNTRTRGNRELEEYAESFASGHTNIQYILGDLYSQSRIITTYYKDPKLYRNQALDKNIDEALKWYQKAAAQGHEGAKAILEMWDANKEEIDLSIFMSSVENSTEEIDEYTD